MSKILGDVASERAVLSGIFQYGLDTYLDTSEILDVDSFVDTSNQVIYKCFQKCLSDQTSVDIPSVISSAKILNVDNFFDDKSEFEYLRSLSLYPIHRENVVGFAVKLKKLQIGRDIQRTSKQIYEDVSAINGEESVDHILSLAEGPVFELCSLQNQNDNNRPEQIGSDICDYVDHLKEHPVDIIGVSSGMKRYDLAIGGGFRRKCVDLIAARPKVGKSVFADNVAIHVAKSGTPVLMLDTEMSKEDHQNRMLAHISDIPINDVSTGKFTNRKSDCERVELAAKSIEAIPYDYISIAGRPFEQTISLMKRWIIQRVGYDENGRINDCLIIYDYLKLMTADSITSNIQEYQALGFQITSLHNFCVVYDCPCLSFVQLNRDGITKETTDVVSGSDRLIWLCTSFSIFKNKSDDEIAEDSVENGNKKLVPIVARHGAGLDDGDYINVSMMGEVAKLKELSTRNELKRNKNTSNRDSGLLESADEEIEID